MSAASDDVQNAIKLISDKHAEALEACKQYIAAEEFCKLNATGIRRLIDAYMAVTSTDDVQYAIKVVTDKHYEALEASKQYLAGEKSSNLDATGIRNLLNACDVVPKLDAYNIAAAAFVNKFSGMSSNDANVCKTLYMIASEKKSATVAAAEFSKLSTMLS